MKSTFNLKLICVTCCVALVAFMALVFSRGPSSPPSLLTLQSGKYAGDLGVSVPKGVPSFVAPSGNTPDMVPDMAAKFVWVTCGTHLASGVIFQRKTDSGRLVTFVWTVAHVYWDSDVQKLAAGQPDPYLIPTIVTVQGIAYRAKMIAHGSDGPADTDCVLLALDKNPPNVKSVKFDLVAPAPGDTICLLGGAMGYTTPPCFFSGFVSSVCRQTPFGIADILECPAQPGCSGAAVFNNQGECVGLMEATVSDSLSIDVPAQKIIYWANQNHVLWAIDSSLPLADSVINPL